MKSKQYDKLASTIANHPDFLKCGPRGLKKLAKKVEKQLKKERKNKK